MGALGLENYYFRLQRARARNDRVHPSQGPCSEVTHSSIQRMLRTYLKINRPDCETPISDPCDWAEDRISSLAISRYSSRFRICRLSLVIKVQTRDIWAKVVGHPWGTFCTHLPLKQPLQETGPMSGHGFVRPPPSFSKDSAEFLSKPDIGGGET